MEKARQMALVAVWAALLATANVGYSQSTLTFPVITRHPGGSVERPGDSVSLSCAASEGVHLLEWFRDGILVGTGSEFAIAAIGETQAGNYTCRATINAVGTVTSATARVQLASLTASPPGRINSPEIISVPINQPHVLSCGEIVSTPPLLYQWDGGISDSLFPQHGVIKGIDGQLYLPLVTQDMEDFAFHCQVSNSHLSAFKEGYIQLDAVGDSNSPLSPRVMMAAPQDLVVPQGSPASFQCIVGGSPLPTTADISWTTPSGSHLALSNNAVVHIRSASLEDTGLYSCNVSGLGTFSATLTVLVPPNISITPEPLYSLLFGDPLSITCVSTNTLVGEWVWFHDGVRLTNASTNTLHIGSAHNKRHNRLYQCFAYNSAGNDSATTSINVIIHPASLREPSLPPPQLLFTGARVSYSCVAYGAPPPSIIWLHNRAPLDTAVSTTDEETRETTSVLELAELSEGDSGTYTCRAVNEVEGEEVGSQDSETRLEVIAPTVVTRPSMTQPLLTLEQERTATLPCIAMAQEGVSLNFTWVKDNSPLTFDGGRVSLVEGERSANVSFAAVEEGDGGIYQCRVVSLFGGLVGPTVESAYLRVSTTPKLLIPPQVHPVTIITSSSFKIDWYFPGQESLTKLRSYTVSYRELGAAGPVYQFEQPVNGENSLIISSSPDAPVRPFTTYNVTVAANYKTGEVLGVSVVVRTSEDKPGAPGMVTGSVINVTTVLVEWMHPQEPNGIITNYTIRYKSASTTSLFQTLDLVSNSTHHHLSPLDTSTSYLVELAASTSVGLGPYSDAITVSTHQSSGSEGGSTPIYERVWFIVVMFVVGLVMLVAGVLAVCGVKYARSSGHSQKYNVQSKLQNDKVNGRNTRSLTEDDMKDYNGRSSRLNGESSNVALLLDGRESESSAGERYRYEPSLSTASHVSSQAPAYINPPPFKEAIKSLRSARISPAYSGSTLDQAPPSTIYTAETESSFWLDSSSKTRILQVDQSPSPAHSYQPSPLHSSPPPPPIPTAHRPSLTAPPPPPPPPLPPQSPTHSEHKYASLSELDYPGTPQGGGREGKRSHPTSPGPGYDSNGYNRLPIRPSSQQRMRLTSTPQYRTTSPQSIATPPSSSPLQHSAAAFSSQDVASSFQAQSGAQTMSSSHANPLNMRSSVQNVRSNTATGGAFNRRGSAQHVHAISRQPLSKTSSQPNFATFV